MRCINMKKSIEELKEMLEGREIHFLDLDNLMMEAGYYSVSNDGIEENIKFDGNVVYTATDTNEAEIQIFFTTTCSSGIDEINLAFYVRVDSVEKF